MRILLLILLLCTQAKAQEVLPEFSDKTLPVLNEELREFNRRIKKTEADVDLTDRVTGILPTANGGTGENFSLGAVGSLITFEASGDTVLLSAGTVNYFLMSNGPGVIPSYEYVAPNYYTLVASSSPSAAAASGDMTIVADRVYLMTWALDTSVNTNIYIRFNNDSSGNDYAYATRELTFANPPVEADEGSAATTFINTNIDTATSGMVHGWAIVNTNDIDSNASVSGKSFYSASTNYNISDFHGIYFGGTVTSIELELGTGNMTGEVRLYRLENS